MIRLSPTSVLKYEACPQQYFLEEVLRVKPLHKPANLVFGGVVHAVVEAWLRSWLHGQRLDAGALFDERWRAAGAAGGISYSSTQSPESLAETGRALMAAWPAAWSSWDRQVVDDGQGQPLIERKLEVQVADQVTWVGKPDVITRDAQGRLECLDVKTPSTPTDPGWLVVADQLTGYQVLLDAHASRLGVAPVARLGLIELVKRKVTSKGKGPEVCAPATVERRPPQEVAAYLRKVLWVAEDIQQGRFPKRSLMAHHSPCGLCDFKGLCHDGDPEGLVMPDARPAPVP